MRRKLYCLFMLMLLVVPVSVVLAVTTDTKGPTVSKLTFDDSRVAYNRGDKIYLNTDMADDVSGISNAYLWIDRILVDNGLYYGYTERVNQALVVRFDEDRPYVIIPDTYIGGKYYISEINMNDYEDNRSWFYTTDSIKYYKEQYEAIKSGKTSFGLVGDPTFDEYLDRVTGGYEPERTNISVIFNVDASDEDNIPATLLDFKLNGDKVDLSDSISYELKIKNASTVSVGVGLSDGSYTTTYFEKSDGGTLLLDYKPSITKKLGIITVDYIILTDIYGNMSFYLRDGFDNTKGLALDYYLGSCKVCETLDDYKFEVVDDGSSDDQKPVLKDVKINKTEFPIPSFAKVEVIASDNKKLADTAMVVFKSANKELMATLYLDDDNVYRGELEISQYAEVGDYKLSMVSIEDAAGNGVVYCNYDYKFKDEDLKIDLGFKLTSKFEADVISSTNAKDLKDKIKNAKDDAHIAIDATGNPIVSKEVFDLIKGTNKTIHIEAQGIEWIFNGKDIKETKDIDTSLNVFYDYNYDELGETDYLEKALFLNFADNGQLPGIATIRIKLDYKLRDYIGEEVFVYYYDEDSDSDKFLSDIVGESITLNDNGWFEFKINHNSTYILSSKKVSNEYVKEDKELISENSSKKIVKENKKSSLNLYIIIGCSLLVVIIVIVVILLRKKNKKTVE